MTNLEIIKRLKTAKDLYDKDTKPGSDKNGGMCHYMKQAFNGVFKEGRHFGGLPMTRRVTMLGLKHLIN